VHGLFIEGNMQREGSYFIRGDDRLGRSRVGMIDPPRMNRGTWLRGAEAVTFRPDISTAVSDR